MNYPNGVTSGDIDSLCQSDNSTPNRHDCIGCSREIEQCPDTRWWFFSDEFTHYKPTHRADFTNAFDTQEGWWCSADCFNELALDAEPHASDCNVWVKEPCSCITHQEPTKLFLVGGAR